MGYYTCHNIEVRGLKSKEDFDHLVERMEARGILFDACLDDGYYCFDRRPDSASFCNTDVAKWYDEDIDMKDLSLEFPHLTFQVHGVGEDTEDIWDHYYHNGESEACVIEMHMPKPQKIRWED